jgi:hypothetical protein
MPQSPHLDRNHWRRDRAVETGVDFAIPSAHIAVPGHAGGTQEALRGHPRLRLQLPAAAVSTLMPGAPGTAAP